MPAVAMYHDQVHVVLVLTRKIPNLVRLRGCHSLNFRRQLQDRTWFRIIKGSLLTPECSPVPCPQ